MSLQQHRSAFDMTQICEEFAKGAQWTYLCHLFEVAEGRKGPCLGQPLPGGTLDVVAVFKACIENPGTVYLLLQTGAAKSATAPQILLMPNQAAIVATNWQQ